jgi:uncharacterized protein YidB (DUF937 family)
MIGAFDLKGMLQNESMKQLAKVRGVDTADIEQKLATAGIKLDDIKGFMFGSSMPEGNEMPTFAAAIETSLDSAAAKKAMDSLMDMMPGRGKDETLTTEAVEGGVVLVGRGALFDKAVTGAKGAGAGDVRPELAAMRDAVGAGATVWFAGALPASATRGMGMLGRLTGDVHPTHFGVSVNAGSTVEIRLAVRLEGGDASKLADTLGGLLKVMPRRELPEGAGDLLDKVDISGSGEVLTAKVSLPAEVLAKLSSDMH